MNRLNFASIGKQSINITHHSTSSLIEIKTDDESIMMTYEQFDNLVDVIGFLKDE